MPLVEGLNGSLSDLPYVYSIELGHTTLRVPADDDIDALAQAAEFRDTQSELFGYTMLEHPVILDRGTDLDRVLTVRAALTNVAMIGFVSNSLQAEHVPIEPAWKLLRFTPSS